MPITEQIAALYARILRGLDGHELEAVKAVRLVVKARPGPEDFRRGATPQHQAAFWGVGRDLGRIGDCELPDPEPAYGEIVLYLDNLRPLTRDRVELALRHELGHALGYSEEEIQAAGLVLAGAPCPTQ